MRPLRILGKKGFELRDLLDGVHDAFLWWRQICRLLFLQFEIAIQLAEIAVGGERIAKELDGALRNLWIAVTQLRQQRRDPLAGDLSVADLLFTGDVEDDVGQALGGAALEQPALRQASARRG